MRALLLGVEIRALDVLETPRSSAACQDSCALHAGRAHLDP